LPLPSQVAVETNWIIDVALQRDAGSQRMWNLAQEGRLTILVPSVCLAESVKALETQFRVWRSLAGELQRIAAEARRSDLLAALTTPLVAAQTALVDLEDTAEAQFWETLEQISRRVHLLEPGAAIISKVSTVRELLNLSPADALVLATLTESPAHSGIGNFISRDKRAFDTPQLRLYLANFGITYHPDARTFFRATRRG
jgi:predicted nucleic acid-binding protein